LLEVEEVLVRLATALGIARKSIIEGIAVPGADAGDTYNDFAFALPASPSYLDRKLEPARLRLGAAADIWDEP
jgi:hypothetical protein